MLQQKSLVEADDVPLDDLANSSEGSVDLAIKLADPESLEFRQHLFAQLASSDPGQNDFAKTVIGYVDAVGKEAAKRRTRLVMVGDFAISFFRQWVLQLAGVELDLERTDPAMVATVETAIARWLDDINHGTDVAAQCIERCTEMQQQVSFNASAANVVEAWLRDLGRICRGELATIV